MNFKSVLSGLHLQMLRVESRYVRHSASLLVTSAPCVMLLSQW